MQLASRRACLLGIVLGVVHCVGPINPAQVLAQTGNPYRDGTAFELPPSPLPVSPGGARVALIVTNGVPETAKLKVRSTGKFGVVCPSCATAQTNVPMSLKCIGEIGAGPEKIRPQYEATFKCSNTNCAILFQKSWLGQVQDQTPVVEIMEAKP